MDDTAPADRISSHMTIRNSPTPFQTIHDVKEKDEKMPSLIPTFSTFDCFPKLPLELRLKIWRECAPGPRVIEILYRAIARRSVTGTQVPIVFRICKESRQEAFRQYELLEFETHNQDDGWYNDSYRRNFATDLKNREEAGEDVSGIEFQLPRLRPFQTYIDFSQDLVYVTRLRDGGPKGEQYATNVLVEIFRGKNGTKIKQLALGRKHLELMKQMPGIIENNLVISIVCKDKGKDAWGYSKGQLVRDGDVVKLERMDPSQPFKDSHPSFTCNDEMGRLKSQLMGRWPDKAAILDKISFVPVKAVRLEEPIPLES